MYDSVHSQLFTLPDNTLVLPAHDYKVCLLWWALLTVVTALWAGHVLCGVRIACCAPFNAVCGIRPVLRCPFSLPPTWSALALRTAAAQH